MIRIKESITEPITVQFQAQTRLYLCSYMFLNLPHCDILHHLQQAFCWSGGNLEDEWELMAAIPGPVTPTKLWFRSYISICLPYEGELHIIICSLADVYGNIGPPFELLHNLSNTLKLTQVWEILKFI